MIDASQHFGAQTFPVGNTNKRVFCAVVLDRSGSMDGAPIDSLNAGLSAFASALANDPVAQASVDVTLISFSDDVRVDVSWSEADQWTPPRLVAGGCTNIGAGLKQALDLIDARCEAARARKKPCYIPWLIVITDGEPDSDNRVLADTIAAECRQRGDNRRLNCWAIGVEGANVAWLRSVSPIQCAMLNGLDFTTLFRFVTDSLSLRASVGAEQTVVAQQPVGLFSIPG